LRRSFVTLIELLLVLALVLIVGGIVGYNVNFALKEQRFKTEVGIVADTLGLAQDLMLILSTDVTVTFKTAESGKGLDYQLELDHEVSKEWRPFIERSRRNLTAVRSVSFEDETFQGDRSIIQIKFLSGGTAMSRGIFMLSPSTNPRTSNPLNRYICLPGFPTPIKVFANKKQCEKKQEVEQDTRLTEQTVQEIRHYETM
jgi:type II secretory pathway pseudopilin PulG